MTSDVNALVEHLDRWRHLPNYQLERRADIFFGLYLARTARRPVRVIHISIVKASSAHQKYFHLLSELTQHDCLRLPPELAEFIFPQARPGLRNLQDQITVCVQPGEFEIDVIYIQPTAPQDNPDRVIGFEEMASWLEGRDRMAQSFAEYLRRWTTPAGALTK